MELQVLITTVTDSGGNVTSTSTAAGGAFGGEFATGEGNDGDCPDGIYTLHAGQLICKTALPDNVGQELEFPTTSVSGGLSCDAAPTCTGDKTQCALLYQTWKIRCPDEVDTGTLLEQAGLSTAEYSSDKLFREGTDLATSVFDAVGFLPESSSCPAGYTFNAMGETYEIPLIHLCELAEILGFLILGLAYLVADQIVVLILTNRNRSLIPKSKRQ